MSGKPQKKANGPRVLRARRIPKKSYADECKALQERMREERGGELMPDSTDIIRAMRDGGDSLTDDTGIDSHEATNT